MPESVDFSSLENTSESFDDSCSRRNSSENSSSDHSSSGLTQIGYNIADLVFLFIDELLQVRMEHVHASPRRVLLLPFVFFLALLFSLSHSNHQSFISCTGLQVICVL